VVGHTTKNMTHGSSWDMEIGIPSVEDVTLGLRPSCDMFNLGSSYFHVPLTTVRHLYNVRGTDVLCGEVGWCEMPSVGSNM